MTAAWRLRTLGRRRTRRRPRWVRHTAGWSTCSAASDVLTACAISRGSLWRSPAGAALAEDWLEPKLIKASERRFPIFQILGAGRSSLLRFDHVGSHGKQV